jgi:ParB/RepB/Spo0J family partition protein
VDSLRLVGQRDPIDVLGSKKPFRIVDGFRRIAAAAELGWNTIRANVHSELSESKAWQLAFTKNVVRKNLSPLERANAVLLARKNGVGTTELADLFGISQRQVERDLKVLELPEELLAICDGRVITVAHATMLHDWGVPDPEEWARAIREQKLGVRELRKKLRTTGQGQKGRMQKFATISSDRVRCYGFLLRATADRREKARAAEALQRVLSWLKTGMGE